MDLETLRRLALIYVGPADELAATLNAAQIHDAGICRRVAELEQRRAEEQQQLAELQNVCLHLRCVPYSAADNRDGDGYVCCSCGVRRRENFALTQLLPGLRQPATADEFVTADGYPVAVGDAIWVRWLDGDSTSLERCYVGQIVSRHKVQFVQPDSRGYRGARWNCCFKHRLPDS